MSKFKLPTPVSDDAVWTEVWKDGECYGSFKVKYQDINAPKWNLEWKRLVDKLSQSERHRADNPKTEADYLIRRGLSIGMLASHYIVDSKMVAADGTSLPHNYADLLELLTTPELYFIAQELDAFSVNSDNFKSEKAAKEAKKN